MRSIFRSLSLVSLLSFGALTAVAHADTVPFGFTGTGAFGNVSGYGTFTTTSNGDGSFTITGVTGNTNGSVITALLPGQDGGDQLYYPSDPHLTFAGVSYQTANGSDINLYVYQTGPTGYALEDFTGTKEDTLITNPFATPEPSSFVLLGTGILTAAGAARRRFLRA